MDLPAELRVRGRADNIYVGATLPGSVAWRAADGADEGTERQAIVIADAIIGGLKYLIPDPGDLSTMTDTGSSAAGIAVDEQGSIHAADVGFNNLRKYVKVPLRRVFSPVAADHPDIFTAFQDQLGLKIESRQAPIAVLLVDHVELPTPTNAVPFLSLSPHDPG